MEAVIPYVNTILIIIGGLLFMYNTNQKNTSQLDEDTIQRLKDAIAARDLEINNLQSKVKILEASVQTLESANVHLKDLAVGKDILMDIKTTLSQFSPLLGDSGMLAMFTRNDQIIIEQLKDLKKLHGDKRHK